MNILLTGGAGFIGSHIIEAFPKEFNFVVVDDLSTGKKENISTFKNVTFYHKSITDYSFMDELFNRYSFDGIIHLAAIASVFKCVKDPTKSSEINFRASIQLMEYAYKYNVQRFLFPSSAAVYGADPKLHKNEQESTTLPISTYGIDKFASEQFLMDYTRRKKLKGTAFRLFNVYGERQDPNSPYSGVLSIFADRTIGKDQPEVMVFGDGKQTRDFIYVKDVVSAMYTAFQSDDMVGKVLNLGTGKETDLLEVIQLLEAYLETNISIEFAEPRLGDIKRSVADIKSALECDWKPTYSFEEGFKNYLNSLSNEEN